jgi:hypothetical protein
MMARRILLALITLIAALLIKTKLDHEADPHELEEAMAVQELQRITPMSIAMIESAMDVLSKGWPEMNSGEQAVFMMVFDPSNSGEIDEGFVDRVEQNYQKIRDFFDQEMNIAYEPDSGLCIGQRLYYIDPFKLHVCPYFFFETITSLKARTLIHEAAHMALMALDRPYFTLHSAQYAALKPTAGRITELPLVGLVVREIARKDTLFHPDAYAHFSLAVSGQPGAMALYLGDDFSSPDAVASVAQGAGAGSENERFHLVGNTWIRKH